MAVHEPFKILTVAIVSFHLDLFRCQRGHNHFHGDPFDLTIFPVGGAIYEKGYGTR